MSARADRVFLPILRELERELPVPIPERVRILRELEYDLEELRRRLQAQGLSAEEARFHALEILAPDGATLRELSRMHAPLYVRFTHGLRGDRLRILERSAWAVAAAMVLAVEARLLLGTQMLRAPSPFIWPVLALGAILFAAVAGKAFEIWIRRDHRAPERGLGPILALAAATVATGLAGAFVELYQLITGLERGAAEVSALALHWLVRSCGLMAVALLLAMTGALAWFVMAHWIALVTGARRDVLGIGRPSIHSTSR
jgi:hypothetical protein